MRCNPYGYATDAGPRHLMGGMYGPEYAGESKLIRPDGIHGIGICQNEATGRYYMTCQAGHAGPEMHLCRDHVRILRVRMSQCCTRCVWPEQARELDESMTWTMQRMAEAGARGDGVTLQRLALRLDDLRHGMDELQERGIIAKRPLDLVEVS